LSDDYFENVKARHSVPVIVHRALIREVLRTSGAVTLVMLSIFMAVRFVGFLRQAADGDIPVNSVLILLLLKLVTYMDVILPLMLYVAILMVLGRWNRDNEMTVIAACGIGLGSFLKPLLVLFLIVGSLVATFSLYLSPLAIRAAESIEQEFRNRSEMSGIVPGVFTETRRGRGVYFVESFDAEADRYRKIFVYGSAFDREGVVVAASGYRYVDPESNDEFLVLQNGTRYEGNPGEPDYRIVEFEAYAVRIRDRGRAAAVIPVKGMPTQKVFASDHRLLVTEWYWRLSKPISLPVLMIFALALSNVNVRRSRLPNMLIAFLIYFLYTNLVGFMVAAMKKQTIEPGWGLWWVHGGFLVVAAYFLYRRHGNKSLLPMMRLRPAH
jgi:lipopolysaccharide export system permease protein